MTSLINSLSTRYRSRRRGFSLIELCIVLVIITLLLAGVMLFMNLADRNQKDAEFVSELVEIDNIGHSLSQGVSIPDDVNDSLIAQSGLMQRSHVSNGRLVSPYGGPITVSEFHNGNGRSGFSTWSFNVPQSACYLIATYDLGLLNNRLINGSASGDRPFTMAMALAKCVPGNMNTVAINIP